METKGSSCGTKRPKVLKAGETGKLFSLLKSPIWYCSLGDILFWLLMNEIFNKLLLTDYEFINILALLRVLVEHLKKPIKVLKKLKSPLMIEILDLAYAQYKNLYIRK